MLVTNGAVRQKNLVRLRANDVHLWRSTMLAAGTRIGPYEILGVLGTGGMGEVYRGRDEVLRREVAIKVLPEMVASDPDRLARFGREARVLATLNHPNIGAIYGFEQTDSLRALVLELIDGETLAQRIVRGPLPPKEAIRIARDVAAALDAAHAAGIVHRDLKPANVMLTRGGGVKVLDFGIAKAVSAHREDDGPPAVTETDPLTLEGIAVGTPAYMSPEQVRGQEVDRRTDLWAIGCVLFEMLTGVRVFAGATASDTLSLVLQREPEWHTVPVGTPSRVGHLLRRCLEKDRNNRWRDAGDLKFELDDVLRELDDRPSTSPARGARARWVERGVWITVLAGVAALAFALGRPADTPTAPRQAITLQVFPPPNMTFSFEGGAPWPAMSPDGRQLAFVAVSAKGEQGLWVRPLDQQDARPLRGTAGAYRPFWSPDSKSLAYFNDGRLWRLDLPNGTPYELAAAPYSGRLKGAWGRDVILMTLLTGIYRVAPSGGSATLLTSGLEQPEQLEVDHLDFLPDGQRYVYLVSDRQQQKKYQCVGSIEPSPHTCEIAIDLPVRYAEPGYLMFIREASLWAQPVDPTRLSGSGPARPVTDTRLASRDSWYPLPFSFSTNGVLAYHPNTGAARLVWIDRSGSAAGRVESVETNGDAGLSNNGHRILFGHLSSASGKHDLWLHDTRSKRSSRFTFDANVDTRAIFSPDGDRVLFKATVDNASGFYIKSASGADKESLLTPIQPSAVPKDWSSNGQSVLYQASDPATGWDLWVTPASGAGKPQSIVNSVHGEREGRFSPDGRWVAYDSTESGRREIWLQRFPPNGNKWQLSTTGGFSPRWRRDGKELFYIATDGRLMAVKITLSEAAQFDAPTPLFQTMLREAAYGAYEVTGDGERFLINVPPDGQEAAPITVVINWTELLRQ
jgi:eukaryotic-like serine/threonine-protein kinase